MIDHINVKMLVGGWLADRGCIGLRNEQKGCSCGMLDLMSCGSDCRECRPVESNGKMMGEVKKELPW